MSSKKMKGRVSKGDLENHKMKIHELCAAYDVAVEKPFEVREAMLLELRREHVLIVLEKRRLAAEIEKAERWMATASDRRLQGVRPNTPPPLDPATMTRKQKLRERKKRLARQKVAKAVEAALALKQENMDDSHI